MAANGQPPSTLSDYLRILRRRKWIIIIPVVLAPLVAVLVSRGQRGVYTANAQVLVSEQDMATNLLNVANPPPVDPTRFLATQAQFAELPEIAWAALRAAGVKNMTATDLLNASTVTPSVVSDFLTFTVTEPQRGLATRLATAYANQYVAYRRQYNTAQLVSARQAFLVRIQNIKSHGGKNSALDRSLITEANQLASAIAVAGTTGSLVSVSATSRSGANVPLDAIFALVLGLICGIGLAFLRDTLDTRLNSADEVVGPLQMRLLARIPRPPRSLRKADSLVMRAEPDGPYAEPFQMLRTSLEFMMARGSRTRRDKRSLPSLRVVEQPPFRLMVTSAIEEEGKSTTVANLAVAFARAGRRVVLVELDFRRPSLDRYFGLVSAPGLTDIVLGSISVNEGSHRSAMSVSESIDRNGARPQLGSLRVVPVGTLLPYALEANILAALDPILDELERSADIVLIDSPPLLRVGDALALTSFVDGVVIVTSLRSVRAQMLTELRRVLDATPVEKLGVVLTGADLESGYGYLSRHYGRQTASVG